MSPMEVPFLSELLPGGLGLLCDDVGLLKFDLHLVDFGSQFVILVLTVSYQTDLYIVESALLLKFVPLLVEDVESLVHLELLHEVADEIVNHDLLSNGLRVGLSHSNTSLVAISHLLGYLTLLSVGLESVEVVQILVFFKSC